MPPQRPRRKATPSTVSAEQPPAAHPPWRALAAWLLVAVFVVLFFSLRLPELKNYTRAEFFALLAMLPDQVVGDWFGKPPEFAIFDRLSVAVPAVALLAVCGLVGRAALALVKADRRLARLDVIFFSFTVGLGLASLYTFGVGICGHLHLRWLFIVPAVAVVVAATIVLLRRAGRAFATVESVEPCEFSDAEAASARRWLWWALPFAVAIALGGTLTPLDFDVREYHLQVPKEFYLQGSIGFLPHNVYGNMPLGSEMLSLAAMAALGDWFYGALVGKTVIALCAPLGALGLYAAGRRLIGPTAGAIAAIVYISIPWIVRVSSLGLVEGVSALFLWATVYAVILWWREGGAGLAVLAGFSAGSAVACKYPNVVFVLIPAALIVAWHSLRRSGDSPETPRRERMLSLVGFAAAVVVACGPWFAKNGVLTGNPTYPLLYGVFDGATRTDELDAQWRRAHRPPGFGVPQAVESAVNVTVRSSWLSPLVLPLALLGVAAARVRTLAAALAVYALYVFAAWWLFTHRIDRFWIPISPVLAFLGGYVSLPQAVIPWRLPLKCFIATGLAFNLFVVLSIGGGDTSYFVSTERLSTDPLRVSDWHQFLNRHLGPQDRLLTVGDALVFDLKMPLLYSTVFDADRLEQLMKGRTAAERRQALDALGVTYVAVDWAEIERYRSPGNYGFTPYITPALFAELVAEGVLDPPLVPAGADPQARYQIFPVHGASIERAP